MNNKNAKSLSEKNIETNVQKHQSAVIILNQLQINYKNVF